MFSKILIAKRVAASVALLATSDSALAAPAPFAIACTGKAEFSHSMSGQLRRRSYHVPRQIYVFDEEARRVQRAMEPRQQFEDVCSSDAARQTVDFSPGLIIVHSEGRGTLCDLKVDRRTGKAEFFSRLDLPAGGFTEMEWKMKCDRSVIPEFNTSRNRF